MTTETPTCDACQDPTFNRYTIGALALCGRCAQEVTDFDLFD